MNKNKTLIGVIIDVSASMEENWKIKEGGKERKIESVKDAINSFFSNSQETIDTFDKNETYIFCLGLGFKLKSLFEDEYIFDKRKKKIPNSDKFVFIEGIVDLLSLSEIVPNKQLLDFLEKELNQMWTGYAENLLENIEIKSDTPKKDLEYFLRSELKNNSKKSLNYKLYQYLNNPPKNKFHSILHYILKLIPLPLTHWEDKIEELTNLEVKRYVERLTRTTDSLFQENQEKYINYIKDKLESFITNQIEYILDRQSLGFSQENIFKYFDKAKSESLAKEIYEYLEKEIRKNFSIPNRLVNWFILKKRSLYLGTRVNLSKLKQKAEEVVKNEGNKRIKPFVEDRVKDLFLEKFTEVSQKRVPYWLSLAQKKEVNCSLQELKTVLPETSTEDLYSIEHMFGNTPMEQALDLASLRLNNPYFSDFQKLLFVVSDGDFYDIEIESINNTSTLLKNEDVKIISCLVSENNFLSNIKSNFGGNNYSRNMENIATEIGNDSKLKSILSKKGFKQDKLIFQINDKESLELVLDIMINDYILN